MHKNLFTLIGAMLALALVAAACGGSDEGASAADQEVIDAVAQQVSEDADSAGFDADCMARAMVTGLGGAEVMAEEFGLTAEAIRNGQEPDDVVLPQAQAISLADEMMECDFADALVAELAGDGISEDDAECLFENIDQSLFRDMVASGFMSDADAAAIEENANAEIIPSMLGAFTECDIDATSLGG